MIGHVGVIFVMHNSIHIMRLLLSKNGCCCACVAFHPQIIILYSFQLNVIQDHVRSHKAMYSFSVFLCINVRNKQLIRIKGFTAVF